MMSEVFQYCGKEITRVRYATFFCGQPYGLIKEDEFVSICMDCWDKCHSPEAVLERADNFVSVNGVSYQKIHGSKQ